MLIDNDNILNSSPDRVVGFEDFSENEIVEEKSETCVCDLEPEPDIPDPILNILNNNRPSREFIEDMAFRLLDEEIERLKELKIVMRKIIDYKKNEDVVIVNCEN